MLFMPLAKEITRTYPRTVRTVAYAANVAPNADTDGGLQIGALTGNITIDNPTGTPYPDQRIVLSFSQDSTGSRTISWGTAFQFGEITSSYINTTYSTLSKSFHVGIMWNAAASKWRIVSIAGGF